ncbi:MAG: long-chain-fatty-acid--CoA ligase [Pseudomonadota bacterium]
MNIGSIPYRNAKRYPNKKALVDEENGRSLTYSEFNERVNRLANGLLALGFKKGDGVGIYSKNCLEMLEAFFACGKIGMVFQPMNWRFRPEEVAYGLNDGRPPVILVHQEFAASFENVRKQCPSIKSILGIGPEHGLEGDYERLLADSDAAEPEKWDEIHDDDVVFICYTGGTTGISKGAMLTHKNVMTHTYNQDAVERITHKDVFLLLGQMFHVAVLFVFPFLLYGAKVVVMNFEARRVLEAIQKYGVTSMPSIATMINYLIDVPDFERYDVSSLRIMSYGSAPVSFSTLRRAMDKFPGTQFYQIMGQTEASLIALILPPEDHALEPSKTQLRRLQGCGREALMSDARVVDQNDEDVPKDGQSVGEFVYRGDMVMKGYLNKPELTAETLRGGWCHSGDLGAWDEDGYFYVVDRKKDMIISGGENIFSAVVEEAVYKHAAVKECAVIGVPHKTWGETVKAVVVLKQGMTATAEEIIQVCKENLASYMKPTSVDFVEELPKAPTGKILKRVLRERYWKELTARRVGAV